MESLVSFLRCECYINEPTKVSLVSEDVTQRDGCYGEYTEAIKLLKDIVSKSLYTWETFPISLPKSILSLLSNEDPSILDVFYDSNVEECEGAAKVCSRNVSQLNKSQHREVRTDAHFVFPCITSQVILILLT
ncbi:unnamed protein product [Heterobilharzia americana]|nr:unnamed protein product [Heterobilharzia americana]